MSDEFAEGARFILEKLDAAPTVDAVEVVHGKWKSFEDDHYICATEFTCSNCKESFCNKEYLAMMKYCPNCGAKMDGPKGE